jgi:hypothetical protein
MENHSMTEVPTLTTRRPTGKVPFPLLLIAGVEKTGKSYGASLFSASDLIDRTFYFELGEGAADQYGELPNVRYEIVPHDGSYDDIGQKIWAATQQPRTNGKPHAIVIDNVTELWDMLQEEQQLKANQRRDAKAGNQKKDGPAEEAQITFDLWNVAKKKWRRIIDMLRVYDGPVILLARLEQVTVMVNGKPTAEKEWKVRAEKNLPFECDGIVKLYAPQVAKLSGLRSTRVQVPPGSELPLPNFTIDGLLRQMGLDGTVAQAPRAYTAPRPQDAEELQDRPMVRQDPPPAPAVPADDEWSSALPDMAREAMAVSRTAAPNPMTAARQKKMFALMAQNGLADRVAGLAFLSKVVGREITSSKQLTKDNGEAVLKALEAMAAAASSELTPFDALMIVVKQAAAEDDYQGAQEAISAELESGQISAEQAETAWNFLNTFADKRAAGVSS